MSTLQQNTQLKSSTSSIPYEELQKEAEDTNQNLHFQQVSILRKKLLLLSILLVIVVVVLIGTTAFRYSENEIKELLKASRPKGPIITSPINVPDAPKGSGLKYKHLPRTFTYPTIGIPQPGKIYNDTVVQRKDRKVFGKEINELLKPYNDTNCQLEMFGRFNKQNEDGTYMVCSNFFDTPYAVINIGINGFDNMGCQLTKRYPLLNYQYDCTNPHPPVCEQNAIYLMNDYARSSFNYICLGEKTQKTEEGTLYTLEDIIKAHQLQGKRIILKIDCEGCEYNGLKYVPTSLLDNVDMILGEFHFINQAQITWGQLEIFRTIAKRFANVNYHVAHWLCNDQQTVKEVQLPGLALELTMINRKLINLGSGSRSFALNPQNFPGCAPQGNKI